MADKICKPCGAVLGRGKKVDYVVGPDKNYYCKDCVMSMASLFAQTEKLDISKILTLDKERDQKVTDSLSIDAPTEIKAYLDEYVIGQEFAKKALSVASYNHYKRVKLNARSNDRIDKSNILMIGPTGSGKTYIIRTLAKKLDVPFAIADATTLTETGYVGADVESVLTKLVNSSNKDLQRAKVGIVFIDEIDKLAQKSNSAAGHTMNNVGVQQALLKLLEGSEVMVPMGGKNDDHVMMDTSDILFICGGAFPALENIIAERIGDEGQSRESLLAQVTDEDLQKFGLIPEFIGRLPVVTTLENLSQEMFKKILTEPKNSIVDQYKEMFKFDGIELEFTEEALDEIAAKAAARKRGARALRTEIEKILSEISFAKPGHFKGKLIVTADMVNGKDGPKEIPADVRRATGGLFHRE